MKVPLMASLSPKTIDLRDGSLKVKIYRNGKSEAVASNGLSGTYHFMDIWHKAHQETNDVVSKVIRYCTAWHDMEGVLQHLGRSYLGILDVNKFGMLSIMLKSREFYFPVVFQERNARRPAMVAELKKVGLIK